LAKERGNKKWAVRVWVAKVTDYEGNMVHYLLQDFCQMSYSALDTKEQRRGLQTMNFGVDNSVKKFCRSLLEREKKERRKDVCVRNSNEWEMGMIKSVIALILNLLND